MLLSFTAAQKKLNPFLTHFRPWIIWMLETAKSQARASLWSLVRTRLPVTVGLPPSWAYLALDKKLKRVTVCKGVQRRRTEFPSTLIHLGQEKSFTAIRNI